MSGGETEELLLVVRADATGFAALEAAFAGFEKSLTKNLAGLQTLVAAMAKGGAGEFQQMQEAANRAKSAVAGVATSEHQLSQALETQISLNKVLNAENLNLINTRKAGGQAAKQASAEELAATAAEKQARADLAHLRTVWVLGMKEEDAAAAAFTKALRAAGAEDVRRTNAQELAGTKQLRSAQVIDAQLAAAEIAKIDKQRLAQHMINDAALIAAAKVANPTLFGAPSGGANLPKLTSDTHALARANNDLHAAARGAAGGVGLLWTTYGSVAPLVAMAAVAGSTKLAITEGAKFSEQLAFIGLVSDATSEQITRASSVFRNMSFESKFSAVEIATGAKNFAQAGNDIETTMRIMPDLAKFATIGQISLAQASDFVTAALAAFKLPASEAANVMNYMAKAADDSRTNIQQIGEAMKNASTIGLQFGLSVQEVAAYIAVLAQRGIVGSSAGTALTNMFKEMTPHTEKAKTVLKQLGLSLADVDVNSRGALPVLTSLREAFSKLTPQSANQALDAYFNNRGAKGMFNTLVELTDQLPQLLTAVNKSTDGIGYMNKAMAILGKESTFKLEEMKNQFKDGLLAAFTAAQPIINDLLDALKKIFADKEFKEGLRGMIVGLAEAFGWLVKHRDMLLTLVGAYAIFKAGSWLLTGVAALTGGLALAPAAMTATATAAGGLSAALGWLKIFAGTALGLVGAALFGYGAGTWLSKFDVIGIAVQDTFGPLFELMYQVNRFLEKPAAGSAVSRAVTGKITRPDTDLRAFRQREVDDANIAGDKRTFRQREVDSRNETAPAKIWRPDGNITLDMDATKHAKEADRLAITQAHAAKKSFDEQERISKAFYEGQFALVKKLNQVKIITDQDAFKQESAILAQELIEAESAASAKQAIFLKLKKVIQMSDPARVQAESEAESAMNKLIETRVKIEARLTDEVIRQVGAKTQAANTDVKKATENNEKLKSEIEAMQGLNKVLQEHGLIEIDTAIKKNIRNAADLSAQIAASGDSEAISAETAVRIAGLQTINDEIASLRILRAERVNGLVVRGNEKHNLQAPAEYAKAWVDAGNTIEKALTASFGKIGTAIGGIMKAQGVFLTEQVAIEKRRKEESNLARAGTGEYAAAQVKASQDTAIASVNSYGSMADSAKDFFSEGSRGYEAMGAVSKVFHMAELAMSIAKLVPLALGAVLNQGNGDPYTAFARMAAMAALVTGLGVALSGGGGGGGGSADVAKERQAANGTGTVLGDSKAKSDSITKALDLLSKNSIIGNEHTASMLDALRNIQFGIGAMANLVARNLGVTGSDTSGLGLGTTGGSGGLATAAKTIGMFAGAVIGAQIGLFLGPIGGLIGTVIGGALGAIGAIKTKTSLGDSGLQINAQTVGQARQGFSGSTYQDVTTQNSYLWGLFKGKASTDRQRENLSGDAAGQFTKVINSLVDGILAAANILKANVPEIEKLLDGFAISLDSISFKDLKGADLEKALTSWFSKLGDTLATTAFPALAEFQKVGEGAFQTLMRLAQEYAATDAIATLMGKDTATAFGGVGMASMKARDDLVELMGGLEKMSTSVTKYIDLYYSEGEKAVISAKSLSMKFSNLGVAVPESAAGFRNLVEAQKLTTEAGRKMFAGLMEIAPAFKAILDVIDNLKTKLLDLQQASYDFQLANAQRINGVGGKIDIGAIAMGRMNQISGSMSTGTPEARIKIIDQYIGAVGTWVTAQVAVRNAQAAAQQASNNAQASAINSQISGLQQQLALAKAWTSVMDGVKKAIDAMRLTISNPASTLARLALAGEDTQGLLTQYRNATGQNRIDLANKLMGAVGTRQGLGQEALQRPSDDYAKLYNENLSVYTEIQADAKTLSEQQLGVEKLMTQLQMTSNALSTQIQVDVADIYEAARSYYTLAGEQYDVASAEQKTQMEAQLKAITGGMDVGLFQAKELGEMKAELIEANRLAREAAARAAGNTPTDVITTAPITINVDGNLENRVLTIVTRNGRVVKQAVENS